MRLKKRLSDKMSPNLEEKPDFSIKEAKHIIGGRWKDEEGI